MSETAYRPERAHADLGDAFFDAVRPADFPRRGRASATSAGRRGSGSATSTTPSGCAISAASSRCRATCPSRWRCATTATSSASTTPTSATAAAFSSRSCATSSDGRLLDLGTKGSGQTPWSRGGDGRLTLKGGVREVLATEMLEALGVYTSKTFSLIETGEALIRGDEPSPTRSSVLVRLSHCHIRIGTFQRLAAHEQWAEHCAGWSTHCVAHYWPEAAAGADPAAALYDAHRRGRARSSARNGSPPASSTACSTPTT